MPPPLVRWHLSSYFDAFNLAEGVTRYFDEHGGAGGGGGPFLEQPDLVALAVFFHDAIYDATATERGFSERASAGLFRRFAAEAGFLSADAVELVAGMILRTAAHHSGPEPVSGDLALFLDIDLSILGASPAAYARYTQQVFWRENKPFSKFFQNHVASKKV